MAATFKAFRGRTTAVTLIVSKTNTMPTKRTTGRERLRGSMTVEEMRKRIFAGKEEARAHLASLPMPEKLRIMAKMREAAAPIRAVRLPVRESAKEAT
jgi:hypothetical protein